MQDQPTKSSFQSRKKKMLRKMSYTVLQRKQYSLSLRGLERFMIEAVCASFTQSQVQHGTETSEAVEFFLKCLQIYTHS